MPLLHKKRVLGVVGVNTPHIPDWMLWLHPDIVDAALPDGRTFVADPKVDPIVQMREVYSPDMYVLLFQDGQTADTAMNRNARDTIRNSYRKDLMTSAEWGKLSPEVANMEYYGKHIPDPLPGTDVLNAGELDFYGQRFERTGFTPAINWYRNISRNWKTGLDADQTVRVPSMMISGEHDVVLRPSMTAEMESYVPDLERHVVRNCWHWTPEEQPEELNRLAVSFLTRRFPAGTGRPDHP